MRRIAFLDRDGVVLKNLSSTSPVSLRRSEGIQFCDGAQEAILELKKIFDEVVIVSNQPDIARGLLEEVILNVQNEYILENSAIDSIYVCKHDDVDKCNCRKPLTGLFDLATLGKEIDITKSIMVGDRWRDIDAGNAFGLKCFFIDYGYGEQPPKPPYERVDNLAGVVRLIRSKQVGGG